MVAQSCPICRMCRMILLYICMMLGMLLMTALMLLKVVHQWHPSSTGSSIDAAMMPLLLALIIHTV